jgi:short-chain fatty acids transporter
MMVQKLGSLLTRLSQRYLPDPFIFAILLTIVVFVMGMGFADQTPMEMILHWQGGFWNLLAFGMQMALIIVLGYAVAVSPLVSRGLRRVADLPQTSKQATFWVAFVSVIAGMISWGFGLVLGALFAREVGRSGHRRGIRFHYPMLGAAAYLSQLVWHAGLSGSAPLVVATPKHFLEEQIGLIPISETIFSSMNLFVIITQLALIPLFAYWVHPKDGDALEGIDQSLSLAEIESSTNNSQDLANPAPKTFAQRLDNSRILTWIAGLAGLVYIVYFFNEKGFDLNINILNVIFLFVGLLLHGTPTKYIGAVAEGTKGVSGVLLQFPFYAGIMGMMSSSGLVGIIADGFVSISTAVTYPLFTFISAALINFFVPSGGGQWAVQGPIMIEAAQSLGIPISKTIMSLAYGDQLTNMIQPFWAIALLGITGLRARQIVGYTATVMIMAVPIYVIATLLF